MTGFADGWRTASPPDAMLPPRPSTWRWPLDRRRQRRLMLETARLCMPPRHEEWAAFGRSTVVAPARVMTPGCVSIGNGVLIEEHLMLTVVQLLPDITPRVVIEDDVRIGRCCGFGIVGELVIERGAVIGAWAMIVDTVHPPDADDRLPAVAPPLPVRIGAGAVLGTHVVVLPGVTIGAGAYVDHHSVVGKDVAPGDWVGGYPARRRSNRVVS